MSAITQILERHFDGGKNLNEGCKDSPDSKTLAELIELIITQGNLADSALTRGGTMQTVEFTNPAAADDDFFVVNLASSASYDTVNSADAEWQTVAELNPPRNITITPSASADIDAVAVVLTGRVRDERSEEHTSELQSRPTSR